MGQVHLELVYRYICAVYQEERALPTIVQIMDACHMSSSQVKGALRTLRQRGWLNDSAPVMLTSEREYSH